MNLIFGEFDFWWGFGLLGVAGHFVSRAIFCCWGFGMKSFGTRNSIFKESEMATMRGGSG